MKDIGSFWEPGNYRFTTRRIEDGYVLCNEFAGMLEERAELEKSYAKNLESWAKRWDEVMDRGIEGGTMSAAYKCMSTEARAVAALHMRRKTRLLNEIVQSIRMWQKVNYRKGLVFIKEKKDMEEAFKKVQNPWAKMLDKVKKTKVTYYDACAVEKSALQFKRNAEVVTALTVEQRRKIDERVCKANVEVKKCRERYSKALQELDSKTPKYMEQMNLLFKKCQSKEGQRLQFFKETLYQVHEVLNPTADNTLSKVYENFIKSVSTADYEADLKWWSKYRGVEGPVSWPKFEDYEIHLANAKGGSKVVMANDSQPEGCILLEQSPSKVMSPPVKVKALYDYAGSAKDELNLKKGEEFEMIEAEDDLGWCKGRKDGKIGLYPASYAEPIIT